MKKYLSIILLFLATLAVKAQTITVPSQFEGWYAGFYTTSYKGIEDARQMCYSFIEYNQFDSKNWTEKLQKDLKDSMGWQTNKDRYYFGQIKHYQFHVGENHANDVYYVFFLADNEELTAGTHWVMASAPNLGDATLSYSDLFFAGTLGEGYSSDVTAYKDNRVKIVNEDFSGLTADSEAQPSSTTLLDDMGWFKDVSLLKPYDKSCTKGWGGDNLYSAGGALAIINGFVNTPTGNYSGNLHISFRARLMDSESLNTADLDILLCRRSKLIDFKRETVTLTKEWKTYTMDATNGSYQDCMVQLSSMDDFSYLIDDVVISHEITGCEVPEATDPFNLVDDGFTAFWKKTTDAAEYLISVFSKDNEGKNVYAVEDLLVEGGEDADSCDVRGLDPNVDYFFTVKGRNPLFTSEPSNEMEVYDVSNPVALPATEITENSYKANWQCNNKVDCFRVDQFRQYIISEDTPNYVILDEDFSNVHSEWGTEDFPEPGEYTSDYYSIDHLTHTGGWTGASLQYAEGMLGGMYPNENSIAGCIATPPLDLSHNAGMANVKIRAFGYEGDWLIIQGNDQSNYAAVNFETYGWVEATLTMPLCGDNERLYIYSNNYYPFMLDYITVTQDLKAGEVVTLVDRSATTDAAAREVTMTNVDFSAATADILYKVTALRYYHGNEKDVWQSPYSNVISVGDALGLATIPYAPIENAYYDLSGRRVISPVPGQIYISNGKKTFAK